jgi:hypothetical protein
VPFGWVGELCWWSKGWLTRQSCSPSVGNRNSSLTLAGRAWRMGLSGSAKVGVAVPTFAATALPCPFDG